MHVKAVLKVEDGKFIADVNTYMHNLDNGYTLQMLSIFMYTFTLGTKSIWASSKIVIIT